MAARKKKRMTIHDWNGFRVMDLGPIEIWDGADLSLLRETLTRLVDVDGEPCIGVNMRSVKYIPSGFFGMLYDCQDKGVTVRLYAPQPNVARMLWFRQFLEHLGNGCHELRREAVQDLVAEETGHWDDEWADSETVTSSREW